jgi:hypothetical protein
VLRVWSSFLLNPTLNTSAEPHLQKVLPHGASMLYLGSHVKWGASTVKWTALDPCSGLSESDPKQYTNFEFYEIKIHKHLENI